MSYGAERRGQWVENEPNAVMNPYLDPLFARLSLAMENCALN